MLGLSQYADELARLVVAVTADVRTSSFDNALLEHEGRKLPIGMADHWLYNMHIECFFSRASARFLERFY